jgi:hypothetical protein
VSESSTWSKDNQRVLLKGFTYTDVTVRLTDEGMHLISASRPKYLDRLIPWSSITQTESKFCDREYFVKEYWNWLMKLKDYTGLLPTRKHQYMIAMTFDDPAMMERNVHITLNVDADVNEAIQACFSQLNDTDEEAPRYV